MTRGQKLVWLAGVLSVLFVGPTLLHAQPSWTAGTAKTVAPERLELGVFGPVRYGLSERLEVATHPGWAVLSPNLSAKISWGKAGTWRFATRHRLAYPTPLLRTLSRRGAGGILPGNAQVPHIFALNNAVLASTDLGNEYLLTLDLGLIVAPRFGSSNMPTIDFPFAYPRTAAYHTLGTGHAGVRLDGPIAGPVGFRADVDTFVMPEWGDVAFEHGITIIWSITPDWRLSAGYRLSVGSYPFGWDWRVVPVADMQFGWN